MRRSEMDRSAEGTCGPVPGNQSVPEECRQFLLLVADCIAAVLHEPSGLGLDERQAVRMAVSFLQEAEVLLGESPACSPQAGLAAAADLTPRDLNRATDMLRAMARQS